MSWIEKKWTSWTPTVTQSGSVTLTISLAVYTLIGDLCVVNAQLLITGTGTAGQPIVIGGQPSEMQVLGSQAVIGVINVLDAGTAQYVGALRHVGATDWRGMNDGGTSYIGTTPSFGLVNGDQIYFQGAYRVA